MNGNVCKYLLHKAEKPSVCLSIRLLSALFGTLITQSCQHRLKRELWDLLEIKAVSLRITKFIF